MAERDSEQSLAGWLGGAGRSVGLVFADIVGSSQLVHGQGTRIFVDVLSAFRLRAELLAGALDGRIVSKEGDEIFAAFLTAGGAYHFARKISRDAGHPLISVRVGLHFGSVSCHEARLVGRAVPLAARVMDHAGPRELWLSDTARQALNAEQPSLTEQIRWVTSEVCVLHGIPEPHLLWRAI
jgi:class 3 adenylate cyclase